MNALQTTSAALTQATPINTMMQDFLQFVGSNPKTRETYFINLRQFAAWMRLAGVTQPSRADILAYRDYLLTEHDAISLDPAAPAGYSFRRDASGNILKASCKPATVKQYLRCVCQLFKWAAANGLYADIAAGIKGPKVNDRSHKKDALNASDVLAIEESIKAQALSRSAEAAASIKDTAGKTQRSAEQSRRLMAMYQLAVNAGLRTIEISRAKVKDLGIKNGKPFIYVWGKGETEAATRKPIAMPVYEAIQEYLASRTDKPNGNSPLFVATGNRSTGKAIAPRTIGQMLKRAMVEAGYNSDRITAHSLRHTTGNAMMEVSSGNIYKTQQYMRHNDPVTTEKYLDNNDQDQLAIYADRLYNHYHGIEQTDNRGRIAEIMDTMTPEQLQNLATFAAAISGSN